MPQRKGFRIKEIALRTHEKPSCLVTMSEDLTDLQRKILELVLSNTSRPSAITSILKRKNAELTQNDVVQALLDLEARKLVERASSKAWSATGRAEDALY